MYRDLWLECRTLAELAEELPPHSTGSSTEGLAGLCTASGAAAVAFSWPCVDVEKMQSRSVHCVHVDMLELISSSYSGCLSVYSVFSV